MVSKTGRLTDVDGRGGVTRTVRVTHHAVLCNTAIVKCLCNTSMTDSLIVLAERQAASPNHSCVYRPTDREAKHSFGTSNP